MEIGKDTLCFLDLKISIIENQLFTTVCSKPTDSHLYLHANSCHTKGSINGIQKGVALRLRRICATNEEYDNKSAEYASYLVARGHNPVKVNDTFKSVKLQSRTDARKKVVRKNESKVIFTTKYNLRGPDVKNIIKNNIHVLQNSTMLNSLYPPGSIIVGHSLERNLKELLLRGDSYTIKPDVVDKADHGYVKCNKKCDSCNNFVDETTTVTSFATGDKFKIRRDTSCNNKKCDIFSILYKM